MHRPPPTQSVILRFWSPLLATWLMMATEGPTIAAMLARLPEPVPNLAAYGVAFAIALILESPIIMMMSASTALARDEASYKRLKRYTYGLNVLVTALTLGFLYPPVFDLLVGRLLELPPDVAARVHRGVLLLTPWPAAIGFRRFFQGVMIRHGRTRSIALGTLVRITTMVTTCFALAKTTAMEGAAVGCAALSCGVTMEALTVRWLARGPVSAVLATPAKDGEPPLTVARFFRFYYPLVLTSLLSLGVQPVVTFFVGRARLPLESLAVLPVVNSVNFFFRCFSLSFQEVVVSLHGEDGSGAPELAKFARRMGLATFAGYAALAFTPLAGVWFSEVSGLTAELTELALLPQRLLAVTPLLSTALSFWTSRAICERRTFQVTVATVLEIAGITATLVVGVTLLGLTGAVAAAAALLVGRTLGAGSLAAGRPAVRQVVRALTLRPAPAAVKSE